MTRPGESKMAPTNKRRIVTLKGYFTGANLNAVQTKIAALRAALSKENQVLYYHDGVTAQILNQLVTVESVDFPVEWGQYEANYTIVLSYWPLDDVHNAPAAVSYGTYVFCALNGSQPIPTISREEKVERQSPDSVRESTRVTISLSGFFEEGSIIANQTKFAALETALATDGLTLTYGSFTQTVKVVGGPTHHEDTMQKRLYYSVQFQYVATARANGVIKLSSMRRIDRVTDRYVAHLVPFRDYASVQLLGVGPQKIHATGYVIANTIANARIAARIEFESQFPAADINGYPPTEDPSSSITEYIEQCRVDWSISRYYASPALNTSLYVDPNVVYLGS